MEGRMRKYGLQASPERAKVWTEPPLPVKQQAYQQGRRIPVVYYLCRNRHLEHPHFIEVPISSPDGLYLRDVIDRLRVLRGKGMGARYSWSCKRSYKNGFVWHDLSEDDLVLPAHGNEYVLKGSELLDQSPPERAHHSSGNASLPSPKHLQQEPPTSRRIPEASSSSWTRTEVKEAKPLTPPPRSPPSQEDELSPPLRRPGSSGNVSPEPGDARHPSWSTSSPGSVDYRVYKLIGAADASTQTEDGGGRRSRWRDIQTRGVSTEDASLGIDFEENFRNRGPGYKEDSEITMAEISPAPTSSSASSSHGKMDTLGSLIRAEATKINSFRILEEEEVFVPTKVRLKAVDVLMHLITCGTLSVKDHRSFGLIPTYKPIFTNMKFPSPMFSSSMMMGELDCLSENPRLMGLRVEGKEYFSGSLVETKKQNEEAEKGVPTLQHSSFYDADRSCNSPNPAPDKERTGDSAQSKCLPRTIKITSSKQSRNGTIMSPVSDGPRKSSARPDCSPSISLHSSNCGSKRIIDTSLVKGSSQRLESFEEESEKVIKIEESLRQEHEL